MRPLLHLALVWLALLWAGAAWGEALQLRGSFVVIEKPAGFAESQQFTGLEWPEARASILVTELPAEAYAPVSDGLLNNPNALADQGVLLDEVAPISIGGRASILGRGRQQIGAQAFEKWLLLVDGGSMTALITAQAPTILATPSRKAAIEAALMSVTIAAERDEPRDTLPFTFEETERFRYLRALSGSAALLTDAAFAGDNATRPLFVIGASLGQDCSAWSDGIHVFAERVAQTLTQVKQLTLEETLDARLGVDRGVVTLANGIMGDQPVIVVQSLRFRECAYIRTVGIAPEAEEAFYRAEFATLAHSVRWR